jgi:aromatic ring-opening dioxygenase catalytic subunit (LigB family)
MDWSWGPADTWEATAGFLAGVAASLPEKPRAILAVTAHWEADGFRLSGAERPGLIYDYSGFPEHTYRLQWPAPGDPVLAGRAAELLAKAGLKAEVDPARGFDHGVFVPLKVAFPEAEIPTVALSLDGSLDPELHLAAGRALAPLRDEGVLIVASGMSFHNLRAYFQRETLEASRAFDAWLTETVAQPAAARAARLAHWRTAPYAGFSHPREEHLIPLMVAAGAGGDSPGAQVFHDEPMGAALSAYRFD